MNKDELKSLLKDLNLPKEIEKILVDSVNSRNEIDENFLNSFANLLTALSRYFAHLASGANKIQEELGLLHDAFELVDLEQKNAVMDFLDSQS